MNVYFSVFGSYIESCRPERGSGNSFADALPDSALQYAGALSGARTTAVYHTRPCSSSIGLCAFALLSQIASLPQYADGCVGGVLCVVGVFASRTVAWNELAVLVFGSRIGKSSVESSGAPYSLPYAFTVGLRRSV